MPVKNKNNSNLHINCSPGGNLHGQIIIIKQKIVKSFVLYSVLFFLCFFGARIINIFKNFTIPHPSDYLNSLFCVFSREFSALPINSKWSFWKATAKYHLQIFQSKLKFISGIFHTRRKGEKSFTLWVALE